jgi:hypothetical protein
MDVTGLLVVPVAGAEMLALRSGHLPTGERVGIAFTTESRLIQVMGAGQRWIQLSETAMKAMLAPLGIARVQVDPGLIAPGVTQATPLPRATPRPVPTPVIPAPAARGRGSSRPALVKEFT